MAQITAPRSLTDHDPEADSSRRERLRSVLPVALSVALLLTVVVTGGYLLRDLLDFGVWFLSQP